MTYISLMLFLVGFFVFFYQAINMKFILEKLKRNEPEFYSRYFFYPSNKNYYYWVLIFGNISKELSSKEILLAIKKIKTAYLLSFCCFFGFIIILLMTDVNV